MLRNATSIHTLPVEILSEIFILISEAEDLGSVTITEVCHRWREVIISTPSVWSFIYIDDLDEESRVDQYLSTFLERSRYCMLHLYISVYIGLEDNERLYCVLSLLNPSSHRIQCLSIASWQIDYFRVTPLPGLVRLNLLNPQEDGILAPFYFSDASRYPRLEILDSSRYTWWIPSHRNIALPSLKSLKVNLMVDSTWINVIKGCASTLVTLEAKGPLTLFEMSKSKISFPTLKCLMFDIETGASANNDGLEWPFDASTPALVSYEDISTDGMNHMTFHRDVKTVTHFRTNKLWAAANFPAIRKLQVLAESRSESEALAFEFIEKMEQDSSFCPTLQVFEMHVPPQEFDEALASVEKQINTRLTNTARTVTFKFANIWRGHNRMLPGHFTAVSTQICL